ncbi:sigma-54 interaction domain-containing protein [Occallatibacter savannae]|uniref:sigma-54 interaction domain-containing protein n=1 Tax=Occallatibacter savannae TaxID=1002691 RepID=UPI000D686D3D|nr:sigma-54 dependent transcriptional regulator [Occallatibacter savannae]
MRSADTRSILSSAIESAGHKLVQTSSSEQARILLNNGVEPDLLVFEAPSSGSSYELRELFRAASACATCVISGTEEQRLREASAQLGVGYFLDCPLVREEVEAVLSVVLAGEKGVAGPQSSPNEESGEVQSLPGTAIVEELGDGRYFLAASASMLKIFRQVQLLADVDAPVLILGESGTGKEVIAHLIHKHSRRSHHRFVNVNCAALPADLLESELFGYQQGAFTGAIKDKPGKFELAHRGTLLLDEIGEMSAQMQAKLLHVLQDGQMSRLGARESNRVDVRVLAATNVPIESALLGRTFREDLYYRLNVFTINVPPLRERREEIPYLIEEIIRRSPEELKAGSDVQFSSRLMDAVLLYSWRGNIRELRNFVTRTMTMRDMGQAIEELESKIAAGQGIECEEQEVLTPSIVMEKNGMRSVVRELKDRTEAQMIKDALDANGWNRRHAARSLNISYRGLLYKIQQHQLNPRAAAMARPAARP